MLLPGPEAQQLATYIGWLKHGTWGALLAGGLFILPGFVSILILSIVYVYGEHSAVIQALFFGLKPAVMAIVLEAAIRIGRHVLKNGTMVALATISFIAIFFFGITFPLLIILATMIGLIGGIVSPTRFQIIQEDRRTSISENLSYREDLFPAK
jgi:chromate transporter